MKNPMYATYATWNVKKSERTTSIKVVTPFEET